MTRFARAKGSKASNEKLPEMSTSWSEMKEQLLNKNKEIEESKKREDAIKQRNANYQAFLDERQEEEEKKTAWADFPETRESNSKFNHIKGKSSVNNNYKSAGKFNFTTKKFNNDHTTIQDNRNIFSEGPNVQFSALKFDGTLNNQSVSLNENDTDSDSPPEETSIREKPEEIVVKKAKLSKHKLKIFVKKQEIFNTMKESQDTIDNIKKDNNNKLKHDSGRDSRMIEKKQNRQEKQLMKKLQKRQEKIISKDSDNFNKNMKETVNVFPDNKCEIKMEKRDKKKLNVQEHQDKQIQMKTENLSEKELATIVKKKQRRAKQAEKRKLFREAKKQLHINDGKDNHPTDSKSINDGQTNSPNKKMLKKTEEINGAVQSDNIQAEKKPDNLSEKALAKIGKKKQKRARQLEKRKQFKEAKKQQDEQLQNGGENDLTVPKNINNEKIFLNFNKDGNSENNPKISSENLDRNKDFMKRKPYQKHLNNQNLKNAKPKDNEYTRKKSMPTIMFVNGKTVEVDYVDGFPVKKEDAERLKKLRKEMISKGLPRSEISAALKLERRRAEKAFAREKKNVCFNCRKSGHNLSECPELGKDQLVESAGTGICFKCGSTEHTHFQCKVVRGEEYKFAQCFICKEQGHISKQCPDNQRGLYPKGGACKVCGDVTHLKKDCPKHQAHQQHLQNSLSIDVFDNRNPDALDSKGNRNPIVEGPKRSNKLIKF